MSSTKLLFNQKILTFCFMMFFISCGSFNTSSFVSSDGLYSDESTTNSKIQSSYYKNYFQEKINEFENNIFTDTIPLSNYVNSSNISYTNSKPSWGDIPDKKIININYHDNFYFNRYLGYGYYYDFGFDHYYWHSPYNYYNWYPYYSYRYWGSRFYPYGYWRPYNYFPYRYNWSNYYGYYYPNNYNNNNQISLNSGRRGSFSGSVEYNNRSSVKKNGNENKINFNNSRSYSNLSNNTSSRYYDRIIVRKDGSSTTERTYYNKYNTGPLKNEKNEFSTSSSNYTDNKKVNNNRNSERRYYSKESSNWRLSGRSYNSPSTTNSNSPRSYNNPNSSRSSSNSNFNSNYSTRSSSSSISAPSSRSYSGNSSSSRTSSSSGSSRGSR